MLKTDRQVLVESKPQTIRSLYDKYGGLLLGYVHEIVKDRKVAEECLVRIFCELSEEFGNENAEGPRNWAQLQRYTKAKLMPQIVVSEKAFGNDHMLRRSDDPYLAALSPEQKQVFVDIYYYGKTVAMLAADLNQTEEFIRKTLKEAFTILRKSGGN